MKQKTVVIENNSKTTIVANLSKSKRSISIDSGESRIENMYPEEILHLNESIKAFMLQDLVTIKEVKEDTEIEMTIDENNIKTNEVVENKPKVDIEIESEGE